MYKACHVQVRVRWGSSAERGTETWAPIPNISAYTVKKQDILKNQTNKKTDINGGNEKNHMGKLGKKSDNRILKN